MLRFETTARQKRLVAKIELKFYGCLFVSVPKKKLVQTIRDWNPGYFCDINKVESVQRRFTKRLKGLNSWSYVNRLKVLNTYSLELRRLKTDLITMYKILCSSSFAVDRLSLVQLYDNMYCTIVIILD